MGFVAGIAIAGGLLFLASLFLKRSASDKDAGLGQDEPTTLTARGSYIPVVFGRRRIGAVFAWAGDRRSHKQSSSGGGKGGGGAEVEETYWTESAWHVLCVGPADKLHAIYADNQKIWEGPIQESTSPSGTVITTAEGSSFQIFWGQVDQPVNKVIGRKGIVGITSRWPHICYIFWFHKKLGGRPTWPQMEYIIEVNNQATSSPVASPVLDSGGERGMNPAHALWQILAADYPHGLGLPEANVDEASIVSMGSTLATEHLPMNAISAPGEAIDKLLGGMLADAGFFINQVGDDLSVILNREPSGSIPSFGDDVIQPPDLERTIDRTEKLSRPVFIFRNEEDDTYREFDIKFDDDGESDQNGLIRPLRVKIETVTHPTTANKVARRRSQESEVRSVLKVKALHGAALLSPGQVFTRPDFGRLRVVGVRRRDDSPSTELECTLDSYAIPDIADVQDTGTSPGGSVTAAADWAFTWFELPASIVGSGVTAIAVLRIRGNPQIAGAAVHVSADGSSFGVAGHQDTHAAGGTLAADFASGDEQAAEGPIFEAANLDVTDVLDLSADENGWLSGRQVLVVNDEVMFLRSLTVIPELAWQANTAYSTGEYVIPPSNPTGLRYECTTAGTSGASSPAFPGAAGETVTDGTAVWTARHFTYQANDVIRARHGTSQGSHSSGDKAYIADVQDLTVLRHSIIRPGVNLCVKTQPFSDSTIVDLSTVTAVCKDLTGVASPDDARVDADGNYRIVTTGEYRTFN